jgi:hypothetical protein
VTKNKGRTGVLLKGGLGNQLFQIAAGIYSSKGQTVHLFSRFTLPRETNGRADSLFFKLPPEVSEISTESTRFERRVLALNLKLALLQNERIKLVLFRKMVEIASDLIFSLRFKSYTKVFSGTGVGFCEINVKPKNTLLNGYFQAHQYPCEVETYKKMQSIQISNQSQHLKDWIDLAIVERPVMVHLRLSDYKLEKGIGVLPSKYYDKALMQIQKTAQSRKIWIFSDEPAAVDRFVKPPIDYGIRVIGDNGLNPAETLELMRHGSAYVIANSTFSWWAAFLSYEKGCPTIMPAPWFQNMPSPEGIKPENWIEIEYLE